MQVDAAKLNEYLPPSCVDKIFLNFSDPWPKKRYHKRRLVHPNQLAILEQCLKENGQIIVKTDNEELFDFGLDIFKQRGYGILEVDRDYQTIEGDFVSEYEARFRSLHQPIYRCIVQMKKKEENQDGLNEKANSSS